MKTEITDSRVALECLKKDCLACRRCAVGGRTLSGDEWNSTVELEKCAAGGEPSPISNVFSTMNLEAEVMVVGQNPGAAEVACGTPFVGPSGKVFDEALKRIVGLDRSDVYVTNTIKCYTQGNRKPTQAEVDNCQDSLDLELKLVKPKVVVALGSFAFKAMTGMSGIMKHCGDVESSPRYGVRVLAMLHPSPLNTNHPDRCRMFMGAMGALAEHLKRG